MKLVSKSRTELSPTLTVLELMLIKMPFLSRQADGVISIKPSRRGHVIGQPASSKNIGRHESFVMAAWRQCLSRNHTSGIYLLSHEAAYSGDDGVSLIIGTSVPIIATCPSSPSIIMHIHAASHYHLVLPSRRVEMKAAYFIYWLILSLFSSCLGI